MKIMELVEKNIRPRDIMTPEAFQNALTVDMALGCTTNMLHLPAIEEKPAWLTKSEIAKYRDEPVHLDRGPQPKNNLKFH